MTRDKIIDKVIARRAGGSVSMQIAWREALSTLPDLPASMLADFAKALPNPWTTRQFATSLHRDENPEKVLTEFLIEANESDWPLEEWLKGFEVMARLLETGPHRPSFKEISGYLECCAGVLESGPRYETFPMTVETMLETYGYEGSGRGPGDPGS